MEVWEEDIMADIVDMVGGSGAVVMVEEGK